MRTRRVFLKETPGCLWTALVPHDDKLREVVLANHQPDSWGGLARHRVS